MNPSWLTGSTNGERQEVLKLVAKLGTVVVPLPQMSNSGKAQVGKEKIENSTNAFEFDEQAGFNKGGFQSPLASKGRASEGSQRCGEELGQVASGSLCQEETT